MKNLFLMGAKFFSTILGGFWKDLGSKYIDEAYGLKST